MLFFKKDSLLKTGIFAGFTDFHSHILPGVDDGIPDMESSLAVLSCFESLGVSQVWCTPHVMEDIPNETSFLKERFAQLKESYQGPVKLNLSAEYMMDTLFIKRLSEHDLLPYTSKQDKLLVETSYFTAPLNFDDIINQVRHEGFFPVLAHPERYIYMDDADYARLHDSGVYFQMNLMSLSGAYGNVARKKAENLFKKGWYSYFGSDLHDLNIFSHNVDVPLNIKLSI